MNPFNENEAANSKIKRKRGVRNTHEYKSETIKKARVAGKSYTNWKGKQVSAREPGTDCK